MQKRSCGRCSARIEDGFFCEPCRSFLSRLGIGVTPAAGLPMASMRPGTQPNGNKPKTPRGSGSWQELVLFDQGCSVGIQTNDPKLLTQLLSTAFNGGDLLSPGAGDHRYSIEAHTGMGGAWYLLRAGARRLGVATTRAEALIRLRSHLLWKIAQAATSGVLVHAGVVAWKGKALELPGRTPLHGLCDGSEVAAAASDTRPGSAGPLEELGVSAPKSDRIFPGSPLHCGRCPRLRNAVRGSTRDGSTNPTLTGGIRKCPPAFGREQILSSTSL
jgi:hypothetical protein